MGKNRSFTHRVHGSSCAGRGRVGSPGLTWWVTFIRLSNVAADAQRRPRFLIFEIFESHNERAGTAPCLCVLRCRCRPAPRIYVLSIVAREHFCGILCRALSTVHTACSGENTINPHRRGERQSHSLGAKIMLPHGTTGLKKFQCFCKHLFSKQTYIRVLFSR